MQSIGLSIEHLDLPMYISLITMNLCNLSEYLLKKGLS